MTKADSRTLIVAVLKRAQVGGWAHPQVPTFSTVSKTLNPMRYDKIAVRRLEDDKFQPGARKDIQLSAADMAEWLLSQVNGAFWATVPE